MTMALLAVTESAWAAAPPDAQTLARFRQIGTATRLNLQGMRLYEAGRLPEATRVMADVLRMREELYPKDRYPCGHPELAQSINNLAGLHWAQGEYARAEPLLRRALRMNEELYSTERYPNGHPDLVASLNNLAYLLQAQGKYASAEPLYRRALQMCEGLYPRAHYPEGHPQLATGLNNLALLMYSQGEYARAEPLFHSALLMRERLYSRANYPQGHPDLASSLNNLALVYVAQRKYARAEKLYNRALHMREQLFSPARFPQGHPHLANSLNNLAFLYQEQGNYAKAEPLFRRALKMNEGLFTRERYPQGHPDLARSITRLAALHRAQGEFKAAQQLYDRAMRMSEALYPRARYPQGHPDLALTLNDLAGAYQDQGDYVQAESLLHRALRMYEGLFPIGRYPQGHPELAVCLNNLAVLHKVQGDYPEAERLYRRAQRMNEGLYPRERYPQGHPDLAISINNLAVLYKEQGEFARAALLYRRALQLYEDLFPIERYPQGHPDLALTINNLAGLYQEQGEHARAERLYHRALRLYECLFPRERFPHGHPGLVASINHLAIMHQGQGEYVKAEPLFRLGLEMNEGLYPRTRYSQGHPHLASSLSNLAVVHKEQGKHDQAEQGFRRALAMRQGLYPRKRYPHGHPELAASLNNLAFLYLERREYARAEPLFRRALNMYAASAAHLATSAPEATALNYLARLPLTRDGYLSVTRPLSRADSYQSVWQSKAALSRLYERRHLAVLAAASSREGGSLWNAILVLRRERESLLLAPADATRTRARDNRLAEINEEIHQKEEKLLPLLPALKRFDELARATPADLRKVLPEGTALIDLLRYVHFEQDPRTPGKKGEKRTPRYVAFVVTGEAITRVELGPARPIEEILELWRRAVQEGSSAEPGYAARVHALLWTPLRKHLPTTTTQVYISPDAALNRLPWAALRDGKSGRILIEDQAITVVPHGILLLDWLTAEKARKQVRPMLLAMGGVAYDGRPGTSTLLALRGLVGEVVKWTALSGTHKELKQIVELAGSRPVVRLEGTAAGAAALLAELPAAQTAHLATHGFFADARFRTVLQLDEKLFMRGRFEERSGAGSRSPMVLSGLVCSGANLPDTPNRGVLTAEAIAGLDLRKMNLAVLSACETGLGDTAGGEGVYGLVRAFHVAGCRNVAATLWKVDDEATAALMVLFYRHLWGKQPIGAAEALRRAQLAVYREPGRIKEWSQGRGPLPVPVPGRTRPGQKTAAGKTSPARAWAGFVLSGPGD
jgi:tetratricopeptide (TPR) repeat protein